MIGFLRPRTLFSLMLVLILAAAVYGFAAANIVPESGAGDGSGTVSGYTIAGIHYTLAANPSNISAVGFTVSPTAGAPAAGTVQVSLDNGATWVACSNPSSNNWTCSITATVLSASSLRVVAAS